MEAAAKPTSRQLARRRREPRGQRQEELSCGRMPDHRVTIAVVRPPAGNRPAVRSWTSSVKPLPAPQPPRQMPPAKVFGHSMARSQKPSPPSQRIRAVEPVSAAPPKSRNSRQQHKQSGSGTWWRAIPAKAKVDSHWFSPRQQQQQSKRPSHELLPAPGPVQRPGVRKNKTNKSLAAAHEQLELMLSRIERARDFLPPPPAATATAIATATTTSKRRSGPVVSVRGGAKVVDKVAKGASRHRARPPPAPPGSPMNSARRSGGSQEASETGRHLPPVPLAHNPQRLMPAKRDALLELLQRTEQHDRGIVDMVRNAQGITGDQSARKTMHMKLPLSLSESPYNDKDRKAYGYGSRSLKERQELHPYPRSEGQILPLRTVAGSGLRDQRGEKQAVMMHMEEKIRQLNHRQEQAMRERVELEQHKQLVTICREKRRQRDQRKQLAVLKKQQQCDGRGDAIDDRKVLKPIPTIQLKDSLAAAPIPIPLNPWKQLHQERDRFLDQCQRSYFYNNSRSPEPWKIYARVASKLSSQLMDVLDANFKQPTF